MLIYHDDTTGVTQLTTAGGGASVAKTTTGVIIAIWSKEATRSDGLTQAGPAVADQVAAMSVYLKEQGY